MSQNVIVVSPGQVLLKRQAIPNIWIQNVLKHNGADDWFLWLCMVSRNCTFTLNYEVLYEHVQTGENASEDVAIGTGDYKYCPRKKLFSYDNMKVLMKGFFKINLERTISLCSYKNKLDVLNKLIHLKENNFIYSEYLFQSKIQRVAIYGCGVLGEYLHTELKGVLDVRYFIDRNAKGIYKKIPIYSLQDKLPEVDGIIITLMEEVDEVKKELQEKLITKILVLKDWLDAIDWINTKAL